MHTAASDVSTAPYVPSSTIGRTALLLLAALLTCGFLAGCELLLDEMQTPESATAAPVEPMPSPALLSPLAAAWIDTEAEVAADVLVAGDAATQELLAPELEFELLPEIDLLSRLRSGFALPDTDDPAFQSELAWYAKHPEYLERVFGRAERYLHFIAGTLEERGMPADLALLPIVESAFDPFAYSHGRAAGLWQIIPGTATRLGIKQDWWFDGRRDVLESTRGALDYLQLLHDQFDGDWLLAIAGYNSGPGNVSRALKRAAAANKGSDFWSIRPYLPRETRTYVPRLLAMRALVAEPGVYGIELPRIANGPYFAVVDTGGQLDMSLAAELAGLDIDLLYELNAGVNRWATDPDGPHRILVPVAHQEQLTTAIAGLEARQRVEWTRHRIASGETLIVIAKRYDTTPQVLRQVNNLSGNTIRAGSHLMIPHAVASLDSYTQSADARAARQRNRERDGTRQVHVVRSGESLWTISRRYGVGVRALAGWNGMAPGDTLSVGRELVVWTADASASTKVAALNVNLAGIPSDRQVRRVNYTVRSGDSLSSIAQRFRVTVPKLVEWNDGLSPKRYLQPGQRLVMFVNITEQST